MTQAIHHQPTFAERYPIPLVATIIDLGIVIFACYLAYFIRFGDWGMPGRYNTATLFMGVVVMISLVMSGVYGSWRGRSFVRQIGSVYFGWFVGAGAVLATAFFLKVSGVYSRVWFATALCLGIGFTTLLRVFVMLLLRAARSKGRNLKGVLLVGEGGRVASSLNSGLDLGESGFKILKSLPFQSGEVWINELKQALAQTGAHEVWLCLSLKDAESLEKILYGLRHHMVEVRFFPDLGDIPLLNHKVSRIAGRYSLDLSCSPMDGPARIVKRIEDIMLGSIISLLIIPVCILIAIAIKLDSPGPILFKQYRMGINGKRFKVYKFRSMVVHEESADKVTQASRGDSRITRLGAFLRKTSLDELPQFLNVLQGRMSIVGPRPHALAHNEYYKDLVESYMQRHMVKPGITGWAQVNGYRGETDTLDKMKDRVEHDLWYIDNWSLFLDLKIIILTVFKGFLGKNAY
ncbi:undecaprenyl-phosphate glucose phosphotransferase [Pseudomonas sp. MS19]|uniref:undecaprenyl-phosphate glucose phosphotransferase n=1 Tax=Pseudomonas sp. MS19 TaxID=2579939 RepID=UPI0015626799|nr:undecaprenyl-phosphate glucose phosphotransferase [Pseudomonas sp. MS19]NRH26818.1 undecaprenyl-phosphate glucose phosphotransferase [Pseudomonas sp. MS19]